MPTYRYKCNQCDETFEVYKPVTQYLNTQCPKCYSENVDVQLFPTNFILKGGGWAKDGYSHVKSPKEDQ